ncbi:hypothetical protein AAZX31_09G165100 [Glycine max]
MTFQQDCDRYSLMDSSFLSLSAVASNKWNKKGKLIIGVTGATIAGFFYMHGNSLFTIQVINLARTFRVDYEK